MPRLLAPVPSPRPLAVAVFALAVLGVAAPRVAAAAADPRERALVAAGDRFRHAPVDAQLPATWRELAFDDSGWPEGASALGYGDDDDATELDGMKGRHLGLALRRIVEATPEDAAAALVLRVRSDDGFVAWLNGREIARARLQGDPPAPDAAAKDHEATRSEDFPVPPGLLRAGRNVLAVQAHNSELHSSDFTIEPQLLIVPRSAAAAPEPARATTARAGETDPAGGGRAPRARAPKPLARHATTLAQAYISNYFQGRAGSPHEDVWSQAIRHETRLHRSGKPLTLTLRGDLQRVGALGMAYGGSIRADWSLGKHGAWITADGLWDRPAFRKNGELALGDSAGLQAGWRVSLGDDTRLSAWAEASQEDLELEDLRDNHDVIGGVSIRLFRTHRILSPEIGIEANRRTAGSPAYEYSQKRVFLRLRSEVSERVSLSFLYRHGMRDYEITRDDRRRLARLTCDVTLRDSLELAAYLSWEDGQSSLEGRAFEGTGAWLGLRFRY